MPWAIYGYGISASISEIRRWAAQEGERGTVVDWEVEHYRNNRADSATVVSDVLDGWGYVF